MAPIPKNAAPNNPLVSVFSNRPFLVLWSNQILLQLSYNMLSFTLLITLFKLTNSNTVSALFLLTNLVPSTLLAMFAGVVADKFDRRKILLITDIGVGVCMASYLFIGQTPLLIISMTLLLNSILQFFQPTESATIPMLVPKKDLLAANSLFQMTLFGAMIGGYAIAGPIIEHIGSNFIFIFGSTSLLISFLLRRFLPPLQSDEKSTRKSHNVSQLMSITKNHIVEGMRFITSNRNVWATILTMAIANAMANLIVTVGPGLMEQVLKIRAEGASIVLLLPLGLGMVTGALSVGRFGALLPRRHIISVGFFLSGIAVMAIVLAPIVAGTINGHEFNFSRPVHFLNALKLSYFISFFAIILGLGGSYIIIPTQTLLQEMTPNNLRGRVFSTQIMVMGIVAAVPVFATGALSDLFGVQSVLTVVAIIIILCGILGLKAEKVLIRIETALLKITRRSVNTI